MAPVIQIRSDEVLRERFARGARLRGMSSAQYLAALLDLHDRARWHADAGDDSLAAELQALGLQTVIG